LATFVSQMALGTPKEEQAGKRKLSLCNSILRFSVYYSLLAPNAGCAVTCYFRRVPCPLDV